MAPACSYVQHAQLELADASDAQPSGVVGGNSKRKQQALLFLSNSDDSALAVRSLSSSQPPLVGCLSDCHSHSRCTNSTTLEIRSLSYSIILEPMRSIEHWIGEREAALYER